MYAVVCYFFIQLASRLRCPITKFVMHTISHFFFLLLLAIATFGLEGIDYALDFNGDDDDDVTVKPSKTTMKRLDSPPCPHRAENILRPAHTTISYVQILIIFWIFGEDDFLVNY